MNPRPFTIRAIGILCASMALSAPTLDAQAATPTRAKGGLVHVTFILVDHMRTPTVLRRSSTEARNVILLGPSTTPRQLSDAVFGFLTMEARDPNGLQRSDSDAMRVQPTSHKVYPWATEMLRKLKASGEEEIPGLGRHRVARAWIERLHGVAR